MVAALSPPELSGLARVSTPPGDFTVHFSTDQFELPGWGSSVQTSCTITHDSAVSQNALFKTATLVDPSTYHTPETTVPHTSESPDTN